MNIVIIGTGKVASSMGRAFRKAGHTITAVAGRSPRPLNKLSKELRALPVRIPSPVDPAADLYLIAVKDDALPEIARWIGPVSGIVAHTSGSVPMEVLKQYGNETGVFYPLDTFTNQTHSNLHHTPICIEAASKRSITRLKKIANTISDQVFVLDSAQRSWLHVAAVFSNNFVNHLNTLSFEILDQHHIPRKLLFKLLASTYTNAVQEGPEHTQTGPAVRNDTTTLAKHLKLIGRQKHLKELYSMITADIIRHTRTVKSQKK